jgi:hypothetical protein
MSTHKFLILTAAIATTFASFSKAELLVYEGNGGIGNGKHIVFIANDHEYRSEEACPTLAKILAKRHGFKCTFLFGLDENDSRFMNLPDEQVDPIVEYFERGGPVVGVRTSTHCFNGQTGKWEKLNFNYQGDDYYGGLGEQIFGNTWHKERGQSHYGSNHVMGCQITPDPTAGNHPILRGVNRMHAYSGAYKSQPPIGSVPLLNVQVLNTFHPSDDYNTEKPVVNAGWTRDSYTAPSGKTKKARVVYASYGASEDLLSEDARRFLVNACLWAGGWESGITPNLNVDVVGTFNPTAYNNGAGLTGIMPLDLAGWDSQIMPSNAEIGGLSDPKKVERLGRVILNRPHLRARILREHPEFFTPGGLLERF